MDYCALKCIPIRLLKTNNIVVQFLPNQKLQKMGILNGSIIYIHLIVFCLENCPKLLKGQRRRICKKFKIKRTIYWRFLVSFDRLYNFFHIPDSKVCIYGLLSIF